MLRIKHLKYFNIRAAFSFFYLVIPFFVFAQHTRFPSDRDTKVILELNYKPEQKINLPVNEIEILDARFNQSVIGITTGVNALINNEFTRKDIIFPLRLSRYMNDKLSDWFNLNTSSDDKLIILVKKFRSNDNIHKMLTKSKRKEVFFLFSASFFLQRNNTCYKLGNVEKWFSSDNFSNNFYKVKKDYHEWLITNVLIQEIQQVQFSVSENIVSFSRAEVDAGIRERFDLPIFNEKIKKGIYYTFLDFLLNKPSDTTYKMATLKSGKILFVDSTGGLLNSAKAWAISDGKMTVYMFENSFYEIEVRNNSIRVRTFRKINVKKSVAIINDLYALGLISKKALRSFAFNNMPDYMDIDMDTGELFLEEIIGLYKSATVTEAVRGINY